MSRNVIIGIIVVAVLVGGGFFLMTSGNKSQTSSPDTTVSPTSAQTATQETSPTEAAEVTGAVKEDVMQKGPVKEFTVTGSSFKFEPSTLTVKKGDTVKIIFKNASGIHDFVIDELNVATKQINSGQSETVEFTANKAGIFEYYCSIGNHRAQGMVGTLTVQ